MHFSRPAFLFILEEGIEMIIIGLTVLALIIVTGIAAVPWVAYFTSDNSASGPR
jgi:hypothetical protein